MPDAPQTYNVVDPTTGQVSAIGEETLADALSAGFKLEQRGAGAERAKAEGEASQYGGARDAIAAGVLGTARGATFGLSDVILRGAGEDEEARNLKRAFPVTSTVTEIGGAVAPAILSGGAGGVGAIARLSPAGATARLALGATERLAGAAPGVARYAGAAAAGGAVEGALQNAGSYVSEVALKNKELSAEGFVGSAGQGALFGGVAGGAIAAIEKGTIAARRLFPRSEAGELTVRAAEQEFVAKSEDVIRAGDELAKTAQQRLDDIALKRAELNLEKLRLKGVKDPAAAERVGQIKVEQAKLAIARREAAGEIAAKRASKAAVAPEEVAPLAPSADLVPTAPAQELAPPPPQIGEVVPTLAGADDLMARLGATQGLLDEGIPLADIGAAARQADEAAAAIDDQIRGLDDQAARLTDKLERFNQGKPLAADFMAKYGQGAKSKYSATAGGKRGGGAGPVRTDRTRLLPEEEIEASINDRVFAGIGDKPPAAVTDEAVRRPLAAHEIEATTRDLDIAGKKVRFEIAPDRSIGKDKAKAFEIKAYRTLSDGEEVEFATGRFVPDGGGDLFPRSVQVEPAMQRQGVASRMYEMAEEASGRKMIPSDAQTEAGKAFSAAYRGKRGVSSAAPGLSETSAVRRAGAELDSAYEDAIERAAAAPTRGAQERALREAADLEDDIFETVAARGGREAGDVAKIRAKRGDLGQDSYTVAARRAEKRAMAEEAPAMSSGARAARDDIEAFDRGLREQQFAGGKTAKQAADEIMQGAGKPNLAEQILGPSAPSAASAKTVGATEAPGLGKFIDDADEAIRVFGEFEKGSAELVQELGDAAPPKAKAAADMYFHAVDDQARKIAESTARSADDAVRAGQLVTLPKAPLAPMSEGRKLGKSIADAAAILDTIQTFGDIPGMPNPRDIPVIGPVLSMYLKVRAGRMALRRIGGRIPATAEAKVAAKSAELRDRAAAVVDRILLGASKTARVARQPTVAAGAKLLDTLSHSLYPHEEKHPAKPSSPLEAVKARVNELSAAVTNPDAVKAAVRKSVQASDPDIMAAIESATLRKLAYLHKHAPKAPAPGLLAAKTWTPGKMEIEKFARRVRAAEDPVSVLDELEAGTLTPEAADTLRSVYPTLFGDVQMRLISRAADLEVTVPYRRRLTISALFDVPLDDSLQPQNLARLQQVYNSSGGASPDAAGAAQGGQPPSPSVAAPVNIARLYADTRANRR